MGKHYLDRTSFHADQRDWGGQREKRPDILFQYMPPYLSQQQLAALKKVDYMRYEGKIILDPLARKPLLDYKGIPKALSSREPGWSMEAMSRQNPWIATEDFLHRMRPADRTNANRLSMRRSRFRWHAGCQAWTERQGSKAINSYLESIIPEEFLKLNNTKGFRDLTPAESKKMKETSKGKFPERRRKAKRVEVQQENAEAGPSKRETSQNNQPRRSRSRGRSRSPRLQRAPIRLRSPVSEAEGSKKAKAKAPTVETPEPKQEERRPSERPEDPYDFRFHEPDGYEDMRIVHIALLPARRHIYDQLGERTPFPDSDFQRMSYMDGYMALKQIYDNFCRRLGRRNPQPMPMEDPWFGGFPRMILSRNSEDPPYETPARGGGDA